MTAERIAKAPNLKLSITAGIGSDHVDLQAAIERGITVAEVTYCNSISVSEHVVMMILGAGPQLHPLLQDRRRRRLEHRRRRLALVRPRGHAGRHRRRGTDRLGGAAPPEAVRRRPALHRPPPPAGRGRGRSSARPSTSRPRRWSPSCDVVTINAPLHPETEHLFDDEMIGRMKRGAYIVNTARGKICDRDAIVRGARVGPARRLRRRRLVPAAGARRTIPGGRCPTTA